MNIAAIFNYILQSPAGNFTAETYFIYRQPPIIRAMVWHQVHFL